MQDIMGYFCIIYFLLALNQQIADAVPQKLCCSHSKSFTDENKNILIQAKLGAVDSKTRSIEGKVLEYFQNPDRMEKPASIEWWQDLNEDGCKAVEEGENMKWVDKAKKYGKKLKKALEGKLQ